MLKTPTSRRPALTTLWPPSGKSERSPTTCSSRPLATAVSPLLRTTSPPDPAEIKINPRPSLRQGWLALHRRAVHGEDPAGHHAAAPNRIWRAARGRDPGEGSPT